MAAQLGDILYAERSGIAGKVSVAEIVTLAVVFQRSPDLVDDTGETYFYWGWTDTADGNWQIRRVLRSDASKTNATISNNASLPDLVTAWSDKTTLNYI